MDSVIIGLSSLVVKGHSIEPSVILAHSKTSLLYLKVRFLIITLGSLTHLLCNDQPPLRLIFDMWLDFFIPSSVELKSSSAEHNFIFCGPLEDMVDIC